MDDIDKLINANAVDLGNNIVAIPLVVSNCEICYHKMIGAELYHYHYHKIIELDIRCAAPYLVDSKIACYSCWLEENAKLFKCNYCGSKCPRSQNRYSYRRDDYEGLCDHCYHTLTAAEWDAEKEKLYKKHNG